MYPPLILLNKQGGIELSYHLCVPVMLELHDLIYPYTLTNGNCMIYGGLLQLSNILPVNPLRSGNYWVSSEDHTSVEVHMKHSVKVVIVLNPLQTSRIYPPLIPGPFGHTLTTIINSSNIVG